ncbi:MAG: glycoside hydrolase family 2 TIM barrel-domain containing protein, partial [Flavobacteriaceae bacterium]|nr:glycoside hydrolase family 2 TIM barrel-domain containing protein [Flavobacteriaceae bacterium]
TELVNSGENSLVVRVDNKRNVNAVPTDVTDWWNYGGITRDVSLLVLPSIYIEDYKFELIGNNKLKGYVQLSSKNSQDIQVKSEELNLNIQGKTNAQGRYDFSAELSENIQLWGPNNPYLYYFLIESEEDQITDKIGLRTIRTEGNKLLLNGKSIFLRGICAHEENSEKGGRAATKEDALRLLTSAKELNANFMRLAHYPHNEYMPRLADSMGILLWEEIPVYWTINWENPKTYKLAEDQLKALISRDKNRASVIIWSLANETPTNGTRLQFLKNLASTAREMDSSRLLSAALFKENLGDGNYTISDPFSEYTDLVSFNQYLGWYEGLPDILDKANFSFKLNKPVIVSEFGAGAKAGFHADSLTRWSEEYQDYLYKETLELMDCMPNLVGFSPWILYDFRSPRRQLPKIQDGWNRKGIIGQKGERKLAFYRLQQYYQKLKEQNN